MLFESLSTGLQNGVALHKEMRLEQVSDCRLYLRRAKFDEGLRKTGAGIFECVLTEHSWDNMAGLMEPFCEPGSSSFQWLRGSPGIRLLISHDGKW